MRPTLGYSFILWNILDFPDLSHIRNIGDLVGFDPDEIIIDLQFNGDTSICVLVLVFSVPDPYVLTFSKLKIVMGLGC